VPVGVGITGLWRPVPGAPGATGLLAFFAGGGNNVFTFRQDGATLTGGVEGMGGGFFGGSDAAIPIQEGKVEGQNISFKAGTSTFSGSLEGGELKLLRKIDFSRWLSRLPKEPTGPKPAVGPPPDGSDPSINLPSTLPPGIPVVLHRVER